MKKFDLVIPCAGIGSRLKHLTKNIPKNMVNIRGNTILEKQINNFFLEKNKINKIHFILGYKSSILKSYILNLKLPFKIKFHINKKFKMTGCAQSLSIALKYLNHDSLILNSDLILKQKIISEILNNKKKNFVYLRRPILNEKSRAVKAVINKNIITKIDILKRKYNYDVVGPFKIDLKSIKILRKINQLTNRENLLKMSCYTFIGKLTDFIEFKHSLIADRDWYEINTLKEYRKAQKKNF